MHIEVNVPEFKTAAEMRAHYAAVRARLTKDTGIVDPAFPAPPRAKAKPKPKEWPKIETKPISRIIQITAEHFYVSVEGLLSPKKKQQVVDARFTAMYLAAELTHRRIGAMGIAFKRDHTTLYHGITKVAERIADGDIQLACHVSAVRWLVLQAMPQLKPPAAEKP